MKRFLFTCLIPFTVSLVASYYYLNSNSPPAAVYAQGTPVDCSSTFTFTAAALQSGQTNASQNTPCVAFRVTFSVTSTLTAVVQFETSPDNVTYTAVPNTICSSSVQPPCLTDGANPMASGATGTVAVRAYGKYWRLNVVSTTGAGTGTARIYGYKGTSASAATGGGGGGGATIASTTSTIKGDGAGNGVAVTGTGTNCVLVNGSSAVCGGSGPSGLTPGMVVDAASATTIETICTTCSLSSGGNYSSPGSYSAGVGGTVAGNVELVQGTAPSTGTTSVKVSAPAAVTSYVLNMPGVSTSGWLFGTNTAGTSNQLSYGSPTNCSSSASPAVCGSAAAGSVVVAAAATTVVVNTSAVTANSQILLTYDSSLGTKLSVTCNTTIPVYSVSARTAATSFTITLAVGPITNPACLSFLIVN